MRVVAILALVCGPLAACAPGYYAGGYGPDYGYGGGPVVESGAVYGYAAQPVWGGDGGGFFGGYGRDRPPPQRFYRDGGDRFYRDNGERSHPQFGYNQRPPQFQQQRGEDWHRQNNQPGPRQEAHFNRPPPSGDRGNRGGDHHRPE